MGRKTVIAAFITIIAAWWVAAPPAEAGFRCDTELVRRGMTFFEVAEICGDPVYEFAFVESRAPGVYIRIDEWLYELGRNKFRRLLVFENGRLRRIETRDKPSRSTPAADRVPGLPGPVF